MSLAILDDLTLDDIEKVELIIGRPIDDLMADGELKGKAIKAIVYITESKKNPAFTIEDAGKFTFREGVALLKKRTETPKA